MALSTPIVYPTLPGTTRPPVHDGRSTQAEQIKLLNALQSHASSVYALTFDFETNGDAVVVPAWAAQLPDGVTWFAVAEVVVTSGAGNSAFWRREALINRNVTLAIVSDANSTHQTTASLGAFTVAWVIDSLYAVLSLQDAVGLAGKWRIRLTIQSVAAT